MNTFLELLKRGLMFYTIAAPALLPVIIFLFLAGKVAAVPLVLGLIIAVGYNVARRRFLDVDVTRLS